MDLGTVNLRDAHLLMLTKNPAQSKGPSASLLTFGVRKHQQDTEPLAKRLGLKSSIKSLWGDISSSILPESYVSSQDDSRISL